MSDGEDEWEEAGDECDADCDSEVEYSYGDGVDAGRDDNGEGDADKDGQSDIMTLEGEGGVQGPEAGENDMAEGCPAPPRPEPVPSGSGPRELKIPKKGSRITVPRSCVLPGERMVKWARGGEKWPVSSPSVCWWCCHPFEGPPASMPEKYNPRTDVFQVRGYYCSWNCVKAHIISVGDFRTQHRITALATLVYKVYRPKSRGQHFTGIPAAPARENLVMFGGWMSIEEFRRQPVYEATVLLEKEFIPRFRHNRFRVSSTTGKGLPKSTMQAITEIQGEGNGEGGAGQIHMEDQPGARGASGGSSKMAVTGGKGGKGGKTRRPPRTAAGAAGVKGSLDTLLGIRRPGMGKGG